MARAPHFLAPLLADEAAGLTLTASRLAEPLATHVVGAFDSASRRLGLLGRASLPPGEALVIAPCNAIHTFRMRFSIDLVYARRDGQVIKLCHAVPPNRMSAALTAFAVVELAAGTIARTGLALGDRLVVTPAPASAGERPRSL
jgi:hypothetical protein